MKLHVLLEALSPRKMLCIFPGAFHPFHKGHASVYQYLKQQFPDADVFVASSNNTSERPFSFEDKKFLAIQSGVPADKFVEVRSPYISLEITKRYNPQNTILIFALSAKDKTRLGGTTKKNGELKYLQPYPGPNAHLESFDKHAYFIVTPTLKFDILGKPITSASQIREWYAKASDPKRMKIAQSLYPASRNITKVKEILDTVLVPKEIIENINTKHIEIKIGDTYATILPLLVDILKEKLYVPGRMAQGVFGTIKRDPRRQSIYPIGKLAVLYVDGKAVSWTIQTSRAYRNDFKNKYQIEDLQYWRYTKPVFRHRGFYQQLKKAVNDKTVSESEQACWYCQGTGYVKVPNSARRKKCKFCRGKKKIIIPDVDGKKRAANDLNEAPDFGYTKFNNKDNQIQNLTWDVKTDVDCKGDIDIYVRSQNGQNCEGYIGASIVKNDENILQIFNIRTSDKWRGTGLGQLLYERLIQEAKKQGKKYLRSDTLENQSAFARSAWERLSKRYPITQKRWGVKSYYEIDLSKVQNKLTEAPDFGYLDFNDRDADIAKLKWKIDIRCNKQDRVIDEIKITVTDPAQREEEYEGIIIGRSEGAEKILQVKVSRILTSRNWRSTGLGQMLYDKLIQVAKQNGFRYLRSDYVLSRAGRDAWEKLAKRYPVTKGVLQTSEGSDKYYQIDLRGNV